MNVVFPFQKKLRDYFKSQKKTWDFFAGIKETSEEVTKINNTILSQAYRFSHETDAELYATLDEVKKKLGLNNEIALYQSQRSAGNNAEVIFIDEVIHIIFSGGVIDLLSSNELKALLGHELGHILLNTIEDGDYKITDHIMTAISNDYQSDFSYVETGRLLSLFTESFCDIMAFHACGSSLDVISMLLKIETGLKTVSAKNYIAQTSEVIKNKGGGSSSHPETFIRAKNISLYEEKGQSCLGDIEKMIMTRPCIFNLHLFSKESVETNTKQLLQIILKPKWQQTETHITHAKMYFPDFTLNTGIVLEKEFKEKFENISPDLKKYYGYVLLDFVFIDGDIFEISAAAMLELSEYIGLKDIFSELLQSELKMGMKEYASFIKKSLSELNQVLESDQEGIYE